MNKNPNPTEIRPVIRRKGVGGEVGMARPTLVKTARKPPDHS
jgi:hypothetical protein